MPFSLNLRGGKFYWPEVLNIKIRLCWIRACNTLVLQASIDFGIRLPAGEPHVSHIPEAKKNNKKFISYPIRTVHVPLTMKQAIERFTHCEKKKTLQYYQ